MDIKSFVGTWTLVGSISINSEISFTGSKPDPNGVENWLSGEAKELVDKIDSTSGLTLSIDSNGSFIEKVDGQPNIVWFDSEGVLSAEVVPFNGLLKFHQSKVYLQSGEVPSWDLPSDEQYNVVLRYDDGDTKICDRVDLMGETLVRTVNVVTDELYLNRVVIAYRKVC